MCAFWAGSLAILFVSYVDAPLPGSPMLDAIRLLDAAAQGEELYKRIRVRQPVRDMKGSKYFGGE